MTEKDNEKYKMLEQCADRLEKISRAAKRKGKWDLVKEARQGVREARYKQKILETGGGSEGWGDHLFVLAVAAAAFAVTMLIHYF
jgi:hypothetical protein